MDIKRQLLWEKILYWVSFFVFFLFAKIMSEIPYSFFQRNAEDICLLSGFFAATSYFFGLNFMKIKFITRNPLTKTFCFLSGIIWTTICLDSLDKIIYIRDFKLPIIAFIIYGIIGFVGQSTLMWTYALLSLGLSIGIYSLRDELRNFDSNFALLGVILILFSCAFTFLKKLKIFAKSTFVIGLLYSLGPILILRRILTPFELVFLLIAINMIPLIMIKMKKS